MTTLASRLGARSNRAGVLVDRIVAVLLFAAVACFAVHRIVAHDIWWQLATGEWILANGFPRTDPFSYFAPDRPWIEMRWLYCIALHLDERSPPMIPAA